MKGLLTDFFVAVKVLKIETIENQVVVCGSLNNPIARGLIGGK
jgi:hypothetical protein